MTILYTGISPTFHAGFQDFWPEGTNFLFNASSMFDRKTDKVRSRKFPRRSGLKLLDSGGFLFLNEFDDYPFGIKFYANMIDKLKPTYFASQDYPCEPEISRQMITSNYSRIEKTVENALDFSSKYPQISTKMLPVIQGYTFSEYETCFKLYEQVGSIKSYMAVGSICKRSNDVELLELIPKLHFLAKDYGVTKLHYFGFKQSKKVISLQKYIYSQDSAAVYNAPNKEIREKWGGRFPRSKAERQEAFTLFWQKARINGFKTIGD